jgi:hypothetical protein
LTAWRDDCIKGELPEDLKEGSHDVVIEPKKAAKQKATFKKNF